MAWSICLILATVIFLLAFIFAVGVRKTRYKRGRIRTSFNLIFGGVTIASVVMFLPIYANIFASDKFGGWKTILLSIHNTIRLFIVDGEFSFVTDNIKTVPDSIADVYTMFAALLFVVAPVLTFGVVLSFFRNISAHKDYFLKYFSEVYIFSELNERSLALARNLKSNDKKRTIVFTDVFENNEETVYEMVTQAYELGAILFKKDIAAVNWGMHCKNKKMCFFIIGQDDDENIKQTLSLISKYNKREKVSLYVFTTSINSELLLNKASKGKIKVRRVNEVQSLISRELYDEGLEIFKKAVPYNEEEKLISAVVVGMGQHGMEMSKALSWFCQMDGYRLELNVFDIDKSAESRFHYNCPELLDKIHNNDFVTKGEAHYKINVYSGVDVESKEFLDKLDQLKSVTYVFIALGKDEKNIHMAVKLRSWLLKNGHTPRIDAVVRNSDKKEALSGITNFSGQEYDIHFIGDIDSSHSEKVIFESDIEMAALERHLRWGEEEAFWKYEYNYRSSIASAIHKKMKIGCKIPGIEKELEQRSEQEKWALRELEHRRWNAYMRSEGFVYAKERNNLAKTHHCLVPFDELSLKEQEKDDD